MQHARLNRHVDAFSPWAMTHVRAASSLCAKVKRRGHSSVIPGNTPGHRRPARSRRCKAPRQIQGRPCDRRATGTTGEMAGSDDNGGPLREECVSVELFRAVVWRIALRIRLRYYVPSGHRNVYCRYASNPSGADRCSKTGEKREKREGREAVGPRKLRNWPVQVQQPTDGQTADGREAPRNGGRGRRRQAPLASTAWRFRGLKLLNSQGECVQKLQRRGFSKSGAPLSYRLASAVCLGR